MRQLFLVLVATLAIGAVGCGDADSGGSSTTSVEEAEDRKPQKKAQPAADDRAAAKEVLEEERQLEKELREEEASERQQAPMTEPEPRSASGGFSGVHASNYEAAKEICSAFPQEQIAQELGLPASADEFEIAEAYADDSYTDRFRQAGFQGCLDGLLGSQAG